MTNQEDIQSVCRILGCNPSDIPVSVLDEYGIRAKALHRCGMTGPVGPVCLLDIIRCLHLMPAQDADAPTNVDWQLQRQDGSCRVEVNSRRGWLPGAFIGFGMWGKLLIRLDGDPVVAEVARFDARLATEKAVGPAQPETVVDQTNNLSEPFDDVVEQTSGDDMILPVGEEGTDEPSNWSSIDSGRAVKVVYSGKANDGKFIDEEDGMLLIDIDGYGIRKMPVTAVTLL
jgi:hypothetical protein